MFIYTNIILALIDWCFTARKHKIDQFKPIYQGELLAQAFEDSQRGTNKNTQLHAIQWTYTCNDKQQVCLTCLKINNAYNKLHEWVKKRKRACNTFSINSSIEVYWSLDRLKWQCETIVLWRLHYWQQNWTCNQSLLCPDKHKNTSLRSVIP